MFDTVVVEAPAGDAAVAAAAELAPGAAMQAALDAVDPAQVSAESRLAMLELYERCDAALAARKQWVLAAIDYQPCADDWTREEVAAALRLSCPTAHSRLTVARALTGRFRETLDLLAAGQITYLHARVLVDETDPLDYDHARRVQDRVLARAPSQTIGEFRAQVRRVVDTVDPAGAAERHTRQRRERSAWLQALDDGMADLGGYITAEEAAVAWRRIDNAANQPIPGDQRTLPQRRADAFVGILTGQPTHTNPEPTSPEPTAAVGDPRITVEVTVSAETLAGLVDEPATLAGYGPVTAEQAREIAYRPEATWTRLIHHSDTGRLTSRGTKTYRPGDWRRLLTDPAEPTPPPSSSYRPPPNLDRFVRTRDRTCRFPGCRRNARRSDLDHAIPYDQGGATSAENLHVLCRRHHRLKHHAGWQLIANPDGSCTWTSPLGHRYTIYPPDQDDP
ncbi:MAG: DUF222 domain-containing protein [Streptosporangiales bacterium]